MAAVLPVLQTFDKRIIPAEFVDDLLIVESSKDVDNLLEKLTATNSEYLVVSDAALWKKLVKKRKTQGWEGYVLPCALEDFSYFKVVYAPIPTLHDVSAFLRGIRTAFNHIAGLYEALTSPVTVRKLTEPSDIAEWLRANVNTPLSVDIETFSLKHWDSGIGSIAFATSPIEATAFAVDLHPESAQIRRWLRQWFERRDAWTLYHNATFDAYILLYQLWMTGLRDLKGMREGIHHITRNIHCSKIISYLALNSAQEISLSLKDLAQEFMGAWAVDEIENIKAIPLDKLLQYNGEDAAAAMWVHQKHLPTATKDGQLGVYYNIFRPAITDVIEMQIVGIPFSMKRVKRVHSYLNAFQQKAEETILRSKAAISASNILAENWATKRNAVLKKKRVTASDWPETFNIGSDQQLGVMLFDVMGLPVLEVTKTGQPSTDGDTLKALTHHTDVAEYKEVLSALLDWRDSQKLLSAFFPSLLNTPQAEDGWHYLCGGYNIGGTLSGRLSSSGPNMQQLPSTGARFARWFKYMFVAPPGWLFVGADFNALESRIDALKTKDPNKLVVYTQGYDSHSWNAYGYWGDQMPDVVLAEPGEECYKANVGDTYVYFTESEDITYAGRKFTGREFRDFCASQGV